MVFKSLGECRPISDRQETNWDDLNYYIDFHGKTGVEISAAFEKELIWEDDGGAYYSLEHPITKTIFYMKNDVCNYIDVPAALIFSEEAPLSYWQIREYFGLPMSWYYFMGMSYAYLLEDVGVHIYTDNAGRVDMDESILITDGSEIF